MKPNQPPQRTHSLYQSQSSSHQCPSLPPTRTACLITTSPPIHVVKNPQQGYVRSALPLQVAGLDRERIFLKRTCHIITATNPYKGLVTFLDQPRGLEVGPPIHNP